MPGHREAPNSALSVRVASHAQIVAGRCSRTISVHQSVQIDLFFDLTGEREVDDNHEVTGASIGLADAGSDLPQCPSSTTSIVRCQRSSVVFSSPKCSTRRCNYPLAAYPQTLTQRIINMMLAIFENAAGFQEHPRIFSATTPSCLRVGCHTRQMPSFRSPPQRGALKKSFKPQKSAKVRLGRLFHQTKPNPQPLTGPTYAPLRIRLPQVP